MKLLRHGPIGHEKPGLFDARGKIRDLSGVIPDIDADTLSKESLKRLSRIDTESLPIVDPSTRLGQPVAHVPKFVAVGLNYSDHAAEAGMALPKEPILFMKATSCLCGPNDDVIQPQDSTKLDWEVELGIVIGTKAQYVDEDKALDYVAGYCLVNDVSERDFQLERGSQWDRGKGCDTFGPVGPWLVTSDEVGDPQTLGLWLDVNGDQCQRGNTSTMVFGCAHLVAYISRFMTLEPGDIITTGTPPGVAMGMKPPRWLKPGDVMTLGIDKLGEQRQRVVVWSKAAA
jgi:2,4-didehydro-3-deoxy-L-rhamnonate hydrolase